ncbi:MAG: trimethylamine methyltransferase family protein [Lentisphaeria bacterium]|nr:trimethylamine methyltransferase family protein [Lentisphaeria bacterium]
MIQANVKFQVLNDDQQADIHAAAMTVIRQTGCEVQDQRGLEIFRQAGALIDGTRVRIGEDIVAEAIERAPKEIVLGDREGKPAMTLGSDRVYFGTGSDCLFVRENGTGERRRAVLEDVRRFARLADALDEIDFVMSMACASDIAPERQYREQFAAMLAETSKPIVFTVVDPAELEPILKMSIAAQGGVDVHRQAPHLLLYAEPISPLVHPETSVAKLLFCGEHRVPVTYSPGSMGGGTTPITGAGSVVQSVAEILTGLVLHQFAYPGSPFVFGGAIGAMDMSTMVNIYCAPFGASWGAALVEMGKRYGLPTWSTAGCSDSKIVDEQSAIDASLMTLCAALSGANLVHDAGYLESGLTSSPEMLVIASEIIRIVGRTVEGLDTSATALGVEAIAEVGPGGNFLVAPHTLEHFREELFEPGLLDYHPVTGWKAKGATSLLERARAKVAEILAQY